MSGLIVDVSGNPITTVKPRGFVDNNGQGQYQFPYHAANWQTPEMGNWLPWIRSPDAEINQFRDRMVSRARDMARNDGWAAGGVMRILDSTIGADLRLVAKPDYRYLSQFNKKFDAVWADEYRQAVESKWRTYSTDVGHYNDVSRQLTISQQFRMTMRHKLVDGDSLMVAYWLPERIWDGGAKYATAFSVIDPDRLSNPNQMVDTKYLRGGVEIDDYGVPIAYHIRRAHQNDLYNSIESMEWARVETEDDDGWQRVIHDFERDRAEQHRGIGIFTPVLAQMKMLARYYGVELQAAVIAASLGTYVSSPYDPSLVQDALDGDRSDELNFYQNLRSEFAKERPAMFNGARIPTLFPGEKIEQVSGAHPHSQFTPFAQEMQRMFAAASGLSSQQVTQDYSQANYSSMRAALAETWKTLVRRKLEFSIGTATPVYSTWLGEEFDRRELPLPRNAPSFMKARTAYSGCDWIGPGRGYIDATKEKEGAQLGMHLGLDTLRDQAAELNGADWEEQLDQREIENKAFIKRGLPVPEWMGVTQTEKEEAGANHDKNSANYSSTAP